MLGSACGECEIVVGDTCIPCPNGADFSECAGCIDGARPERADLSKDLLIPIVVGVATTLMVALIAKKLMQ